MRICQLRLKDFFLVLYRTLTNWEDRVLEIVETAGNTRRQSAELPADVVRKDEIASPGLKRIAATIVAESVVRRTSAKN